MVWLSRPYHFYFFKASLPQILLGPFLNTLSHIFLESNTRDLSAIGECVMFICEKNNKKV